ncbi:hybrid sensor histidine kinase/response regulator [Planctomycetes bacterium K23_9]|uniref:histidine kinase n=1 Tax=Stieleria marina TaxID=1930275 RepID=A0A517NWQ7_9BACT|nr:Wide host range VirA protein [Planctomycetes bacterium K23_9]
MKQGKYEIDDAPLPTFDSVSALLNSINSAVIIDDMENVEQYFASLRKAGVNSFLTAWKDDSSVLDKVLDRIETLWLNPLSVEIFEVDSEQALRDILPHAYVTTPSPFVDFLEALFLGETYFQAEFEQPLPSGKSVDLCVTSHMTTLQDRLVSICTFTDIKWYRDQRTLADLLNLRGNALMGTKLAAWELDIRCDEYVVDREYGTLVGVDPLCKKLSTSEVLQFVHADDRRLLSTLAIDGHIDREFRVCRSDGRSILVHEVGSATRYDSEGKPVVFAGTIRDVTQASQQQRLHEVEKSILEASMEGAEENQVLHSLARGVDHAVLNHGCIAVLFDQQHRIIASAAGNEKLADCAAAAREKSATDFPHLFVDCIGKKMFTFVPNVLGEHDNTDATRAFSNCGVKSVGAMPIMTRDNQVIGAICLVSEWPNDRVSHGLDDLKRLSRLVALVIQERRQENTQRLLDLQSQNRLRFASLGRLAGGIAHDFNNLLTAIISNAQLCEIQRTDPAKVSGATSRILQASEVAASLCRQMLTYAGQVEAIQRPINLVELAERMVSLIHPSISPRILLDVSSDRDVPSVLGDDGAVSQVVLNLLTNASEAIDDVGQISVAIGKKTLDRESAAQYMFGKALGEGQYVCLSVTDNGCGLSEDAKKHLFDPFFSTKQSGRGLGLATVIGIIENLGAAISAESKPKQGTRFEVVFPLASRTSSGTEKDTPCSIGRVGRPVLIVDDRDDIRTSVQLLLESQGIRTIGVESGEEALVSVKSQRFGLVFLDQQMPGLSGLETYRRMRASGDDTPVCFMTGFAATSELEAVNRLDATTTLVRKPLGLDELKTVFQRHASRLASKA